MRSRRIYPAPVGVQLDPQRLAILSEADADMGEEIGLEGNQQYRDLRGVSWDVVSQAVERERQLFERFAQADDLDAEAEAYAQELEDAELPEEDLWGLDVGVISAVLALSAMGAVTVSSCNAGGFGGRHVEAFPLVVFYLPPDLAPSLLTMAGAADVGLDMLEGGLVRLFGRTDYDLHRFAEVALRHSAAL